MNAVEARKLSEENNELRYELWRESIINRVEKIGTEEWKQKQSIENCIKKACENGGRAAKFSITCHMDEEVEVLRAVLRYFKIFGFKVDMEKLKKSWFEKNPEESCFNVKITW